MVAVDELKRVRAIILSIGFKTSIVLHFLTYVTYVTYEYILGSKIQPKSSFRAVLMPLE